MVSPLDLERHHLGELDAAHRAAVDAALANDPKLAASSAALSASDAEILAAHSPAAVAAEVNRRARAVVVAPARSSWWVYGGGTFAAACAALVLFVVPTSPPTERAKGDTVVLSIQREAGREGAAHAGERVQLRVQPGAAKHAVVVSLDGRGSITRHFPLASSDTAIVGTGAFALPTSLELDDAPTFERFFVVTSQDAIDLSRVEQAIRRVAASGDPQTAALDGDSGWVVKDRVLEKMETH